MIMIMNVRVRVGLDTCRGWRIGMGMGMRVEMGMCVV